jgi:hypothetical protein
LSAKLSQGQAVVRLPRHPLEAAPRGSEEQMVKLSTKRDAKRFINEAFKDRISWVACRLILVGVTNDEGYMALDEDTRTRIERFLKAHPAPPMGSKKEQQDGPEGTGIGAEGG